MYRKMRAYIISSRRMVNSVLLLWLSIMLGILSYKHELFFGLQSPEVLVKLFAFLGENVVADVLIGAFALFSGVWLVLSWNKYRAACGNFCFRGSYQEYIPGFVRLVPVVTWTVGIAACGCILAFLIWYLILGII